MIGLWEDLGPFLISASQVLGDPEQTLILTLFINSVNDLKLGCFSSKKGWDKKKKKNPPVSKETDQGICLSNPEF